MAALNLLHSLTFAILIAMAATTATAVTANATVIKGAYWFRRPNFPPSAINSSLFTHIIYAFLNPSNTTYTLNISNSTSTTLANFTSTLRTRNPPVKILFSVGGGASNSRLFAKIAAEATARATFINSTIDVARRFGFDGVDLDWEFPENPKEMDDLGDLFRDWRLAITSNAKASGRPPLLLTAAVYFASHFFVWGAPRQFPVASINENLDFINVMSYDLHGSWSNNTGAPAGLFDKTNVSAIYGLQSWIRDGVYPQKIVMGLPLYGRTWTLRDQNLNHLGAPAVGPGPGSEGAMTLLEIEEFNNKTGATVAYDADTVTVYSYSGTSWIGYDDPLTVTAKVGYAQALGLRGYFFWAAGSDGDKITRQASKAWILA